LLDYYDIHGDGTFGLIAQTRTCFGGCVDPVEAVVRRGVDAIIVHNISPPSLMRFRNAAIRVMRADRTSAGALVAQLVAGRLDEIDIDEFHSPRRSREKGM